MGRARSLKLKYKILLAFLLAVILLVCLSMVWGWGQKKWFIPIEVVAVTNKLHYVDPALVKKAVADEVKQGFFGVKLPVIRDKLLLVPWIAGVKVQRKWHNAIMLTINECEPLAVWNKKGVIDTTGKLFFPATVANLPHLPEFNGAAADVNDMVDKYLLILAKIKPIGLAIKSLTIMPDRGWQAMLDNGVSIILGKIDLEERLTRFVLAYEDNKAGLGASNIQVIDLRYTNGLAVGVRN